MDGSDADMPAAVLSLLIPVVASFSRSVGDRRTGAAQRELGMLFPGRAGESWRAVGSD